MSETTAEWRAMLRIHCEKLKEEGRWAPQHLKATEVLDLLDDADELRGCEEICKADGQALEEYAAEVERLKARIAELEAAAREVVKGYRWYPRQIRDPILNLAALLGKGGDDV